MSNARTTTCKLLEMMDDGILDPRQLAEACLSYMSESEVSEMAESNELLLEDEDEEEEDLEDDEEEYEDDEEYAEYQVTEQQEWHDFDPDC